MILLRMARDCCSREKKRANSQVTHLVRQPTRSDITEASTTHKAPGVAAFKAWPLEEAHK